MLKKRRIVSVSFSVCLALVFCSFAFYEAQLRNPPSYSFTQSAASETKLEPTNPIWIVVDGRRLLLRSAYADLGESWRIRILSYRYCLDRGQVMCHFHGKFLGDQFMVNGTFDYINMAGDGECINTNFYEAYFLYCGLPPMPRLALFRPTEVSVSATPTPSSARLPIDYTPISKSRLAICVPAMVNWTDPYSLILFLEYYIDQCADQFLLYYRSSSPLVLSVLDHYSKLGIVKIVPWPVAPPTMNNSENAESMINYHGQLLAITDCLWRLRNRATYAALIDLDEFIVPAGMTLLDLLSKLDNQSIGGFMFVSSFAYITFPWFNSTREPKTWNEVFNFTHLPIFKDDYIHNPGHRSKMVVKPEAIQKETVHSAWKFSASYENYVVDSKHALLHHIRQRAPSKKSSRNDIELQDLFRKLFSFKGSIPLYGLNIE